MDAGNDTDMQVCLWNHERSLAQLNDSIISDLNESAVVSVDQLFSYIQAEQCEEYKERFHGGTHLTGILFVTDNGIYVSVNLNDIANTRQSILSGLTKLRALKTKYEPLLSIEKLAKYLLGLKYKIETFNESEYCFVLECCELDFIKVENQNAIYMVNCFNSHVEKNIMRIIEPNIVKVLLSAFDENYFKTNNYINLEYTLSECEYNKSEEIATENVSKIERKHSTHSVNNHCLAVDMYTDSLCNRPITDTTLINEICLLGYDINPYQQTFIDLGLNMDNTSIICDAPSGTGKTLCTVLTALLRLKRGKSTIITSPTDSGCMSVVKELKKVENKYLGDGNYGGCIINLTSYTHDISDDGEYDDSYSIESYLNDGYFHVLWKNENLPIVLREEICEAFKEIKLIKMFLEGKVKNPTLDDINRVALLTKYKNVLRRAMFIEKKPRIIIVNLETLFRDRSAFEDVSSNALLLVNEVELIERWRIMLLTIYYNKSSFMFVGDSTYIGEKNRFLGNNSFYQLYFNQNIFYNNWKKLSLHTAYRYKTNMFRLVAYKLYKQKSVTTVYDSSFDKETDKCFMLLHKKNHQFLEETNSIINKFEAEQAVFFVNYWTMNNISYDDIAILCFYKGQKKLIRSMLPDYVKILTIEECQGLEFLYTIICTSTSENDDIINDNYRFRIALTRAQLGMHIIIHENVMDDFKKAILEEYTTKC
uniref:AAA_11 domain-containing protein n=1 Tax=Parastrongyloides trichosuri TaxID=131310 RepID=A0A0N5A6P4_PARTI